MRTIVLGFALTIFVCTSAYALEAGGGAATINQKMQAGMGASVGHASSANEVTSGAMGAQVGTGAAGHLSGQTAGEKTISGAGAPQTPATPGLKNRGAKAMDIRKLYDASVSSYEEQESNEEWQRRNNLTNARRVREKATDHRNTVK